MRGFQAEGAAPLVTGEPVPDPETIATAIRIGNPASWKLAEAAARRVRRPVRARSPTSRSSPRSASSPRRDGVFVEPASAAGVAGLLADARRGASRTPASTVVVTVTGHGLKDIDTALSTFADLVDTVVDADVDAAAAAAGLALMTDVRRRAGHGSRCRRPAPTSAPASTRSASPSTCATSSTAEVVDDRASRSRSTARARAPCRSTRRHLVVRAMRAGVRRAWAAQPPGLRLRCRNAIPHGRGLGLVVGRDRRPASCWPAAWSTAARCRLDDGAAARARRPSSRATPTTSRRRCSAASRSPTRGRPATWPSRARRSTRGIGAVRVRAARRRCRPTVARGLLPDVVPHADAAANAGRAALLVAALGGRARAAAAPRPRTCLHQEYRRAGDAGVARRWSTPLRADGLAAVVSGAGPTVLALVAGDGRRRGRPCVRRPAGVALHARGRRSTAPRARPGRC